ncbi:hypothetical protein LTS08_005812 [Lithohypha guttulata]|uniref:Uncharacterized protein n=1 Tax=Lithohypha guttulata TaxID=1690604 RepID=A0AAN7Y952_9EURO|nr:hypothetical protein LTR51_002326 [Lithohypha guttulata]KAK5089952.1 hypothetical protein LTR05_000120 [Lithohypha guttulata]KAK5099232.1 hypothetical protein LTS08_005812 [Lithohypha guttulata]
MVECPRGWKRNLIPIEAYWYTDSTVKGDRWTCIFKCQPGVPSHDPLIDAAKEDVAQVKADIESQIVVLSDLSTPAGSRPGSPGFKELLKESPAEQLPAQAHRVEERTSENFFDKKDTALSLTRDEQLESRMVEARLQYSRNIRQDAQWRLGLGRKSWNSEPR